MTLLIALVTAPTLIAAFWVLSSWVFRAAMHLSLSFSLPTSSWVSPLDGSASAPGASFLASSCTRHGTLGSCGHRGDGTGVATPGERDIDRDTFGAYRPFVQLSHADSCATRAAMVRP